MAQRLQEDVTSPRGWRRGNQGLVLKPGLGGEDTKCRQWFEGLVDWKCDPESLWVTVQQAGGLECKVELISKWEEKKLEKELTERSVLTVYLKLEFLFGGRWREYEADAHCCTANGLVQQCCGSCRSEFQLHRVTTHPSTQTCTPYLPHAALRCAVRVFAFSPVSCFTDMLKTKVAL